MTVTVISQSAAPALSLVAAKEAARIDGTAHDVELQTMITAFTVEAEHITGRTLMDRTYRVTLDGFPSAVDAPASPVRAVAAINYVAADGVERTLNPNQYRLNSLSQVVPVSAWPETAGAVMVDFLCGYGSTDATVPASFKAYIGAKVAEHFSPITAPKSDFLVRLLDPWKVYS